MRMAKWSLYMWIKSYTESWIVMILCQTRVILTHSSVSNRHARMSKPTAKQNVMKIYMNGIRDGNAEEAMKLTGARYTQHSTGVEDGAEGFKKFFIPFVKAHPERDIKIIRILQEGRNVFCQAAQNLEGKHFWITMDFFDSDEDGLIIEHWDSIEAWHHESAPEGVSQHGGVTEVSDLDKTQENKALVLDFIKHILIERNVENADKYLHKDYIDHNLDRKIGLAAFKQFYGASDCSHTFQEVFMTVAEGNFVATLNKARSGTQDLCQADLYRVENGLIVEHWDATEPVPPKEELVNGGKF